MNAISVDLNLLAVLDALLDERNVTRAARRVHLSQPATSNALARLRQVFGDPLLVRSGRGLVLTPRAEALIGPLRHAMEQIDVALGTAETFYPATSTATFTIATSDALQIGLVPALLARLAAEAPGVRIVCTPLDGLRKDIGDPLPEHGLASGQVDLAIGYFSQPQPHHHVKALFDGDFVCVTRKGHPVVGPDMTLRQFVELGHVVISAAHHVHSTVDAALARRKLTRRVAVVVPQYSVVPYVLARSDHVAVLPRRLAEAFLRTFGLQLIEPPLALAKFTITQVWHERTHRSAAHGWFRRLVEEHGSMGLARRNSRPT
ncbi:LysR family transcriptional regulator [Piscinibacter sp. XHJ-5]|uniref:LysR family transcriptional regulator n=1 Tax=Piscinibacter sp. XHJ-5 TaxID=3037797 RepID=UPI0024530719|nr:LysR family transcriptional regulator [Piscinibacter sp. XHJ-5]